MYRGIFKLYIYCFNWKKQKNKSKIIKNKVGKVKKEAWHQQSSLVARENNQILMAHPSFSYFHLILNKVKELF